MLDKYRVTKMMKMDAENNKIFGHDSINAIV